MRLVIYALIAVCAAIALQSTAAAEASAKKVPQGFVGMNLGGPAWQSRFPIDREASVMARSGVETVVLSIFWDDVQARPGGEFDWSVPDRLFRPLAARKLTVLPILFGLPSWSIEQSPGASRISSVSPSLFAQFAVAAVRRYGPEGSFWDENPQLPKMQVRTWQVWNEPMMRFAWPDDIWVAGYVRLLEEAYPAIKQEDPGATVDVAGLTYKSWEYLEMLYEAGASPFFDRVSLHPYSASVGGVVEIVRRVRALMTKRRDRRPIIVSELSWPSATGRMKPRFGYEVTERLQAARVDASMRDLARLRIKLGVVGVAWYSWVTTDTSQADPFDYAGLSVFSGGRLFRKPALRAFRERALKLRGCERFGNTATDCQKP